MLKETITSPSRSFANTGGGTGCGPRSLRGDGGTATGPKKPGGGGAPAL